jgi:hypothetical protein
MPGGESDNLVKEREVGMRKGILWAVIVCAVAYGGVKGWLWYDVKRTADRLVAQAAPFAQIQYGGIYTSLTGTVGVDNVTIRPTITRDEFRIRAVRIEAPNLLFFVSGGSRLEAGHIPPALGFEMRGVELDFSSELFRMLEDMQQMQSAGQPSAPDSQFMQFDALGCGQMSAWRLNDYIRAGLGRTNTDIAMRMEHDRSQRRLTFSLRSHEPGLFRFDADLNMSAPSDRLADVRPDEIPRGHLTYTDAGWYQLRNAYCARLNGDTEEAYVARNVELLGTRLGVVLPPEVQEAYRGFMLEGGTVSITMDPMAGTSSAGLEFYSPKDVIDLLSMRLAINGVEVDPVEIEWAGAVGEQSAVIVDAPPDIPRTREPVRTPSRPAQARATPQYRTVAVRDLANHLNRPIRVTTQDGRVREGVLTQVDSGRIHVALQGSRGGLTFWVAHGDIRRVDVLN